MQVKHYSIVERAPDSYPRQQGLSCGEYNARGIITGFGVPFAPPATVRLRVRMFGYSFVEDLSDLLESHGVSAPVCYASQLSADQKIKTIKDHIDRNHPVILAIGNGHLRRGYYSPLARRFVGHYITVYGYCQHDDTFCVYDPYLDGRYHEKIPVGNEVRTACEILRDWSGPIYYKWIRMDHVYIPAGGSE